MPTKYLVIEIKKDADLGKIVESLSGCADRLAVVDEISGVFGEGNTEDKKVTRRCRIINPAKKRRCAPVEDAPASDASDQITPLLNDDDFPEGLKENIRMALDASMFEDFADASESVDGGVVRTLRKRGQREDGETALSVRRKVTETTLMCGLCHSKMTLRASYGRTRLREHVMRHLNMNTAQCGHCEFKGVLREHVRRHYILKHKDISPSIIELEPTEDYNTRFDHLWKVCFPTIAQIQPRMTSQRARAHEAQYYDNLAKPDGDESQRSELNNSKLEADLSLDYIPQNSTMAALTNSLIEMSAPVVMNDLNGSGRSDELFYEPRESFAT